VFDDLLTAPPFEQGPIRPPNEAFSLLVRVTRGCPYNHCTFCPVYKGQRFSLRAVGEIEGDLSTMAELCRRIEPGLGPRGELSDELVDCLRRFGRNEAVQVLRFAVDGARHAFLQDANSLIMPAADLERVLQSLRRAFPSLVRVTTYARAHTVTKRSAAELERLRRAGLDRVHIGVESGSDEVLRLVKKGATAERHLRAGALVKQAGLGLSAYVMPGLGGRRLSAQHADETARVLRGIDPDFVRLRSLAVAPGSPLEAQLAAGELALLDDIEVAGEIRRMLAGLTGMHGRVVSDHALNLLEEVEGQLPGDLPRMLALLDRFLALDHGEQELFVVGRRCGVLRRLDDLGEPERRARAEQAAVALRAGSERPLAEVARERMARLV